MHTYIDPITKHGYQLDAKQITKAKELYDELKKAKNAWNIAAQIACQIIDLPEAKIADADVVSDDEIVNMLNNSEKVYQNARKAYLIFLYQNSHELTQATSLSSVSSSTMVPCS